MKKFFYLIPLVGMLTASCASDEPGTIESGNKGEGYNSYLTINIQPTSGYGTRADNTQGDGTYRDGTPSEQQINSIRFFFFDSDGNGAPVSVYTQEGQEDTYYSYIDWLNNSDLGAGIPGETVSATVSATLGLFIKSGVDEPESMIAVINPSPAVTSLTGGAGSYGPTRSQVQTAIADFQSGLTDGNFVMSNSVYAAGDPLATVNYTSLIPAAGKPTYFQNSVEAAQANPVTIWVERVVARLDLSLNISNATPIEKDGVFLYPVMKKVEGSETPVQATVTDNGTTKKVYVTFLGWNVTSTPDRSFLVKMINPKWTNTELFKADAPIWNTQDYHRCFWAMNPTLAENNYQYGNFNGTASTDNPQPATAKPMPGTGEYSTTYMMENASIFNETTLAATAPKSPTQVILGAQLVDENNVPITLAEWRYEKYTQSDLLIYLATNIISQGNFYKQTSTGYASLTAEDLCFVSAQTKYPEGLPSSAKDYYSYVELKADPAGSPATQWFIKDGEGTDATYTPTTAAVINNYIMNSVGYTMSWYNGFTYYYFDVRHLGQPNSVGYNGIVRNHLYEAIVTSLYGYGTPVPNPDEVIIPQTPEYEETLLAAQIRILEWRVVRATYDLEWR